MVWGSVWLPQVAIFGSVWWCIVLCTCCWGVFFFERARAGSGQLAAESLSPPDPSVNYFIARDTHHEGTTTWFIESSTFKNWKEPGGSMGNSLLCVFGIITHFEFHRGLRQKRCYMSPDNTRLAQGYLYYRLLLALRLSRISNSSPTLDWVA